MSNESKQYAAVIRLKGVAEGEDISVQEFFYTQGEAEVWIASQKHDTARYEWGVMKYA